MLLSELAERTQTSTASIKYYLREGLLPVGATISATRADYGEGHVERLQLIRTLREHCRTPVAHIAALTRILDTEPLAWLDALAVAQLLALGFDPAEGISAAGTGPGACGPANTDPIADAASDALAAEVHDRVGTLMAKRGWPPHEARVRGFVESLLIDMARQGHVPKDATLETYSRLADEVARYDIEATHTPGTSPERALVSVVIGTARHSALLVRLVALAHASRSIAQHADGLRGDSPS